MLRTFRFVSASCVVCRPSRRMQLWRRGLKVGGRGGATVALCACVFVLLLAHWGSFARQFSLSYYNDFKNYGRFTRRSLVARATQLSNGQREFQQNKKERKTKTKPQNKPNEHGTTQITR